MFVLLSIFQRFLIYVCLGSVNMLLPVIHRPLLLTRMEELVNLNLSQNSNLYKMFLVMKLHKSDVWSYKQTLT